MTYGLFQIIDIKKRGAKNTDIHGCMWTDAFIFLGQITGRGKWSGWVLW